ncbi:hypothetical protein [Mangrovicoccus algicola]|uniref:Uncharacterized protein n=1 Tax=Mangrovicoccus algicola TaxID=2771008 RepID=A0A8J6Z9C4_9RHOB|nr:hypothetical protein [Mangrovicoccus algicola]MBE3638366.1 hypothetical protein [Mangrovicoccus algicola]
MDVQIGEIVSTVTVVEPQLLRDPRFIRQVATLVKEELAREELEQRRRQADRQAAGAGEGR